MNMAVDFSIIIPHFNSVKLITELLESLLNFNECDNLEIIIVDDNSPVECYDEISRINREKYDNKIRILKNNSKFSGAGAARNVGLQVAQGKWILFADADDLFFPNFYQTIHEYIKTDADVVFFVPASINHERADDKRVYTYLKQFEQYFEKGVEDGLRYNLPIVWSRLYQHDFLKKNQITFSNTRVSNDVMFSLKVGVCARKVKVIDKSIYIWRFTEGSLTTKMNKDAFKQRMEVVITANRYLKENLERKVFLKNRYTLPRYIALSLFRNKMGLIYTFKLISKLLKANFGIVKTSDFTHTSNFFKNNRLYKKNG